MNFLQFFTQRCIVIPEFFICRNDGCCFDRSSPSRSLLHSSSTGLQDIVDTTQTEEFCQKEGEYDRTSLLYHLADDVDHIDQSRIKGGSSSHA